MKILFVECGCCGHYHTPSFQGDCREDEHRYTADEIEALEGPDVWESVLTLEEQEEYEG